MSDTVIPIHLPSPTPASVSPPRLGRVWRRILGEATVEDYICAVMPHAPSQARIAYVKELQNQSVFTRKQARAMTIRGHDTRFMKLTYPLPAQLRMDFNRPERVE